MKIVFVLSFIPNPRMNRRIELLKKEHEVSLIYWNRGDDNLKLVHQDIHNYEILIPTSFGNPLKRIFKTRKFGKIALNELNNMKPDVVYVQGLDMLSIAMKYKKKAKHKVEVMYEIADLNTLLVDKQKSLIKKVIRHTLVNQEKRLIKHVKALVITSEKFYESYYCNLISKDKVVYIPNIPDLSCFRKFKKNQPDKFTVGYIGSVRYENQLKMLIDAAKEANVNVFVAGFDHKGIIKDYCVGKDHVEYYGPYQYQEEIAKLYGKVHLIYSVYDANMTNVSVALPNRLYEAIYCELPLLASKDTYLGELVETLQVGVTVGHTDYKELVDTLRILSINSERYLELVASCKRNKDLINLEPYNQKLLRFLD